MIRQERIDLAEWGMKFALRCGADQVAISISHQRDIEIQQRDRKVETVKESTQNTLSLQIYFDHRYSAHSTNDLRKEPLGKFIQEAVAATKYLNQDEFRALPDTKYYPQETGRDLHINDEEYERIDPAARLQIAREIEAAALQESSRIISVSAGYSDAHYQFIRLHSNGFFGQVEGTMFTVAAEVAVDDGKGGRPEDWDYASVRFRKDLPPPAFVGKQAVERALRKIGQKKITSGRYPMIVENRSAGRLWSLLQIPMTAHAIQQKSSFLEGMLNQSIASEKLTVIDQPLLPKGLASRYFDGEGLAAKTRTMIEKGILRQYYVDDYYGKKLGMEPTSGSPSNLLFEIGTKSLQQLISSLKRAILVTGFLGGNSNPTTGDFSLGIVGLLIENGQPVHPINEMNISGNAKELWNQLIEVGNDPYPYSSTRIPSMLFESVQFSGL